MRGLATAVRRAGRRGEKAGMRAVARVVLLVD